MTEGLKEKTKKWGCYHCSCCRFYHGFAKGCELPRCAYILVSVAQQEIDKLKTFRDNAVKKWCDSQAELERERGLQKQKLQQLIHQWDNQGHLGITIQETDWLLGEFGSLRKLAEELLK